MTKSKIFKTAIAAAASSMLFAACGDDSSSSSDPNESGEIVSISDKAISGVSQKGPFVTGSTVTLYELDENFKQTGKSFAGDIASDDGAFKIDAVELASQYAFLKANGYYRNEVTGEKSAGTITLNAITDLSDREKVNVNLLTHLEYERAMYLVQNDSLSVAEAKAQAEKEVFKAFGIDGDFDNSEDLDIFSKGEGNAALLAISVLMQGDRSEAELTEFLKKFASDIKEDGTWDDEKSKVELADWALQSEFSGKLETVRQNIASWKLGDVPEIVNEVRKFWTSAYGLKTCDEKNRGVVAGVNKAYGKLNNSPDIKIVCKDKGWEAASYLDIDTYGLAEDAFTSGSEIVHFFRRYHENQKSFYYTYDVLKKEWRQALDMEGHPLYVREPDSTINSDVLKIKTFLCEGDNIGKYAVISYRKPYSAVSLYMGAGSFYCDVAGDAGDGIFDEKGRLSSSRRLCKPFVYKCTDKGWELRNEKDKTLFKDTEPDLLEASLYYTNEVHKVNKYDGLVTYVDETMTWIKYDEELGWSVTRDDWVATALNDQYGGCTAKKEGSLVFVNDTYYFCTVDQGFACSGGTCADGPKVGNWENWGSIGQEMSSFGKKCETVGDEVVVSDVADKEKKFTFICTANGWRNKN